MEVITGLGVPYCLAIAVVCWLRSRTLSGVGSSQCSGEIIIQEAWNKRQMTHAQLIIFHPPTKRIPNCLFEIPRVFFLDFPGSASRSAGKGEFARIFRHVALGSPKPWGDRWSLQVGQRSRMPHQASSIPPRCWVKLPLLQQERDMQQWLEIKMWAERESAVHMVVMPLPHVLDTIDNALLCGSLNECPQIFTKPVLHYRTSRCMFPLLSGPKLEQIRRISPGINFCKCTDYNYGIVPCWT